MPFGQPNSGNTLSINYRPGENKRLLAYNSYAIFKFGDFTIEKEFTSSMLTSTTKEASFDKFSTLTSLNAKKFETNTTSTFIQQNELNLVKKNPKSHSYFSSFYTNIANSINYTIENYPYAI